MITMLSTLGKLEVMETNYSAFRASRNFHKRAMQVKEYLFMLEKGP
jgi:adenine-specific DNA-methyltransferase